MKPIYVLIIAVLVGAAGFFGGMKYSQSTRTNSRQNFTGQFSRGNGQFQGSRQFNSRPVSGEIITFDDKSITVKMPDNQSKIVLLNDTTQINQASQASKTDLKVGTQVAVFGSENSDGSMTAQNIQLNPQLGRFINITPGQNQ